jgi:DNA repair protein RecN (Recombination protein N)
MLLDLFIKDFGIIEKTAITFESGVNVLSGETGSGKSVIIDALQVAAGGRASAEFIRSGCDRSIIQLTADISGLQSIAELLAQRGINGDSTGVLTMTRELSKNRSICRINGQITTLHVYRELGQALIDIQGQHDQILLFQPEKHLQLLDAYGGEDVQAVKAGVKNLFKEYLKQKELIGSLQDKHREWARRQDVISYQLADIDGVSPVPGEEMELVGEKRKLVNIEKLSALVSDSYRYMYGGGPAESIMDLAGKSVKNLEKAADLDPVLTRVLDLTSQSLFQIEEACREMAQYMDGLEFFPARLEHVEGRLEQLDRLKKKYGDTIEEILLYRDAINRELGEMVDVDQRLEAARAGLEAAQKKLAEAALALTGKRQKYARLLEQAIKKELNDLEMAGAEFVINFERLEVIGETGSEKAEFYMSANAGEPVRPLSRVASGGEASRILLAVKGILAQLEETPTLVFDEVDTGIGGMTIKSVAHKLKKLSAKRQVICVTHSASVASIADRHMTIRKTGSGGRTVAVVTCLGNADRVDELARMLGGDGKTALDHARQLLVEAGKI